MSKLQNKDVKFLQHSKIFSHNAKSNKNLDLKILSASNLVVRLSFEKVGKIIFPLCNLHAAIEAPKITLNSIEHQSYYMNEWLCK